MQRALAEQSSVVSFRRRARQHNDLISLAAPVLEVVLRVRADLDTPSDDLRHKIVALLKEMEQRGATLRYRPEQIQAVKFALAAFVDETALAATFPLRDQWEKYPLQLEYFGEHRAGLKFFDRLDELLRQPEQNAEAVEVYYLCLLLGFEGRYKMFYQEQLRGVIDRTAEALRKVGRLEAGGLSPHWRQDDQPPPPAEPGLPRWAVLGGGALLALLLLSFVALKFLVEGGAADAQQQLLR
ncbi:MAG TPA: type IVB secretion system protein IcmH/DotU [Pyrinomonadaceae bacterium]|jgi:type VI secretion system protein ImpK